VLVVVEVVLVVVVVVVGGGGGGGGSVVVPLDYTPFHENPAIWALVEGALSSQPPRIASDDC
jgi:hypothetical protein